METCTRSQLCVYCIIRSVGLSQKIFGWMKTWLCARNLTVNTPVMWKKGKYRVGTGKNFEFLRWPTTLNFGHSNLFQICFWFVLTSKSIPEWFQSILIITNTFGLVATPPLRSVQISAFKRNIILLENWNKFKKEWLRAP